MRELNGNNILYHYLQKNLLVTDEDFFKLLIRRLVIDLSIWWPVELYREMPVLLPYVKRDNKCRKSVGGVEAWGTPDSFGFLRDDNTLIKDIPRSLRIKSKYIKEYEIARKRTGFVASHVWQKFDNAGLTSHHASKDPELNSFVPNLVWLPAQLSKLSDREASYTQSLLKAMSRKIYFEHSDRFSKKIWEKLSDKAELKLDFSVDDLNFFEVKRDWLDKKKRNLATDISNILSVDVLSARKMPEVKCSKYLPNLKKISRRQRAGLNRFLKEYRQEYLLFAM